MSWQMLWSSMWRNKSTRQGQWVARLPGCLWTVFITFATDFETFGVWSWILSMANMATWLWKQIPKPPKRGSDGIIPGHVVGVLPLWYGGRCALDGSGRWWIGGALVVGHIGCLLASWFTKLGRPQIQICNIIAECHPCSSTDVFLRAKVVVTTKHVSLQMCGVSHSLPMQVL